MKLLILYLSTYVLYTLQYSLHSYDLPSNHLPFYFRHFPSEFEHCKSSVHCPFKDMSYEQLPCWGYEDNCEADLSYSRPSCYGEHKTWFKSIKEQISLFYEQGDFGYIRKQRNSIMVICEPTFKEDTALECSSHLQFCRGRNIFMNFTSLINRKEPFRYQMDVLSEGNFGGHCNLFKKRLIDSADHVSPLQSWAPEMRYFTRFNKKPIVDGLCDILIEKPTFIMKIDATVNMYHHFCDFFNLYASLHLNMSHPTAFSRDVQIIIWETYPYSSSFAEIWKAFSMNSILTLRNFIGKTVCFKNVVFPLLPRMIFGLYYNTPLVSDCEKSGLFKAFSEFILHRLKIKEYERNSTQVRITLLSRQTSYRNILNEKELLEALHKNQNYEVRRSVFDKNLPFSDQLEIIHNTDIFIGVHGAGLTHLLFLPDWAGVFELYNCEDKNCYMDLARLRGIKYITWENNSKLFQEDKGHHPEGGSHAKFTNYAFDVQEFLHLVDKLATHVQLHEKFKEHMSKQKNLKLKDEL